MFANIDYVKAFSITHAAKDLRAMINAVSGEGKRYLYRVSYGTQLALRLLQLDDVNLDGVILDSLVPLQDDKEFDLSKRSQAVDMVGKALIDKCTGGDKCLGQSAKILRQQLSILTKDGKSAKSFSSTLPDTPLSNVLGAMLDIPHLRNDIPTIIYALT
jgi:pimeloyl-ACP methyl ester carboxylesterase